MAFSYVSYMCARSITGPRPISGQADQDYHCELDRWRDEYPHAPLVFEQANRVYGRGRSVEDRVASAGAYFYKKARFHGWELDYRVYHQ